MFYNIITERIIEKLEAGTIPWHKPWRSIGAPRNLVSKKLYRGVNVWLLTVQGYTSPYCHELQSLPFGEPVVDLGEHRAGFVAMTSLA